MCTQLKLKNSIFSKFIEEVNSIFLDVFTHIYQKSNLSVSHSRVNHVRVYCSTVVKVYVHHDNEFIRTIFKIRINTGNFFETKITFND